VLVPPFPSLSGSQKTIFSHKFAMSFAAHNILAMSNASAPQNSIGAGYAEFVGCRVVGFLGVVGGVRFQG